MPASRLHAHAHVQAPRPHVTAHSSPCAARHRSICTVCLHRYRLAVRLVRLRVNTFLVDTDVIFFDDPYLYFKSPPFANFTVINQPEVRPATHPHSTHAEAFGRRLSRNGAGRRSAVATLLPFALSAPSSPPRAPRPTPQRPQVLYDQADYVTETEPNGGVLYVQNAAPDGPVSWLLSEVVDRWAAQWRCSLVRQKAPHGRATRPRARPTCSTRR
jgi:hypothetical protein